jgi:hypothetical protein
VKSGNLSSPHTWGGIDLQPDGASQRRNIDQQVHINATGSATRSGFGVVPHRGGAPHVYQNLVGVSDLGERRSRILDAAEGRSQALPPPPRPFVGVPPRIVGFSGRSDELGKIDAILMQDKSAAVTQGGVDRAAVHGMGGVGKTSIAMEYAHRYRALYAGMWWCPAETRVGLLSSLADLAVSPWEPQRQKRPNPPPGRFTQSFRSHQTVLRRRGQRVGAQ